MDRAWHFLGSSTLQPLGKLTLREDAWRLPTGAERRYPVLQVGLTVGVVPFVDREHVLLIRQFRHLARETSWELPGGGGQPGESPEAAAQRELREEGGHRAGHLLFLTRFYPSNAYLDETAHCFVGLDLTPDPLAADDDEFFERRVISFRDAVAMALDDRITESVSKVALLAAALRPDLLP
ncbi:MAG TPA: NUDIX hydrolase [Methylomirabilota bacterium]|nr:NUDIX hydrolase [Methylomirabilota bacterium]